MLVVVGGVAKPFDNLMPPALARIRRRRWLLIQKLINRTTTAPTVYSEAGSQVTHDDGDSHVR